jgi:hypothetical protein
MSSLLNLLLRLARCSSGTATVEAALVMPVMVLLMAGGVEFGRWYSVWSTADKSMRDAARYLTHMPCDGGLAGVCTSATAICGWGLTNAQNLAVYGEITPQTGDPKLIANWTTGSITLQQPSDCTSLPNPAIIQLTATVPFTAIMMSAVGLSNSRTFNVQHEERFIGE